MDAERVGDKDNHVNRLFAAALAPLAPIALGVAVMRAHGVATRASALQGIALALGIAALLLIRRASGSRVERALPLVAAASIALIASSLAASGMDGVHRWVPLGPLRLHASSMVAPATVVGIASLVVSGRAAPALLIAVAVQFLHVLQPDAASATAFAAAVACVISAEYAAGRPKTARGTALFIGTLLAMAAGTALAWRRPDPLLPVAHVEGIVELSASHGPAWLIAAVASLAAPPVVIAWLALEKRMPLAARAAAAAIAAHLAVAIVATRFGAFPVPLLGQGASPILGIYVGLGLIAALAKEPERSSIRSSTLA